MEILKYIVAAAAAYLLGSINSSILVSRLAFGVDIRQYGSGNAGLTNSFRTMGAKRTAIVLVVDFFKGFAAALIGSGLGGDLGALIGGVFVIVGHIFPLYFGFKGGKGVLTAAGFLLAFDWRVFCMVFGVFLVVFLLTRWVSLGSILGAVSVPVSVHLFYQNWAFTLIALCVGGAVVVMHRSNIVRLAGGKEPKFSFKSKPQLREKTGGDT